MQAHILIIDDQPENNSPVVSALRNEGWRVSVAESGRQGFHRAQALQPDLILLDVMMPQMDGLATCRLLKESPRTGAIPVIFLTSANDNQERLDGLRAGAVDYVAKTRLADELIARIRIHLRQGTPTAVPAPTDPMPLLSDEELTLRAAMRLINANLAQVPSVQEIARQVGTHDRKLSAIFRRHLGLTVFGWIREERLRVSRAWLADSNMSIQDIAAQIGFNSAANFATAFRTRVGATPSQYRKNMQDKTDTPIPK